MSKGLCGETIALETRGRWTGWLPCTGDPEDDAGLDTCDGGCGILAHVMIVVRFITNKVTHSGYIEYVLRFQPLLWGRQLQAVRPGRSLDHIQFQLNLTEFKKHRQKYHSVLIIFS